MNSKWTGYIGWTLGAIGLGVSFYLISVVTGLRTELSEKDSLVSKFQDKVDSAIGENSQLSQTLDSMSNKLDSATSKIEELESAQEVLQEVIQLNDEAATADSMFDALPDAMAGLLGDEDSEGGNALKKMMASMAERMNTPEMKEMSAKMQVNMQYADYLEQFANDPEKQELIRQILMEQSMENTANAFAMMTDEDGIDASLDNVMNTVPTADLLAGVLTPEELADFEVYEEGNAGRMMRKSFDMQLGMMASGISEDGRAVIGDIYMDEWDAVQADPDVQAGENPMINQLSIYERALERSADYLTETEYNQFESFVDYQQTIMEQFGLTGENDGNKQLNVIIR